MLSRCCVLMSVMYERVSSAKTHTLQSIDLAVFSFEVTRREKTLTEVINPIISSVFALWFNPDSAPPPRSPTCHTSSAFWFVSPAHLRHSFHLSSRPSVLIPLSFQPATTVSQPQRQKRKLDTEHHWKVTQERRAEAWQCVEKPHFIT